MHTFVFPDLFDQKQIHDIQDGSQRNLAFGLLMQSFQFCPTMQEHTVYTVTSKLLKVEANNIGSLKRYLWTGEIWKAPTEHSALDVITLEAEKMNKCKVLCSDDKGQYLMSERSE